MSKEPTVHLLRLAGLQKSRDFAELLLPEERAQHDRYLSPAAADEYFWGRVLMRRALALATGAAPMDLVFERNAHGKPFISAPPELGGWQFNLTGTRGLVAMVVAKNRVCGLDAEWLQRIVHAERVVERFFAPREVADVLHTHNVQRRFFDYWTLKESYIKARGMGMAIPLDSFSFTLDPVILHDAPDIARWHFSQKLRGEHLLALCIEGEGDVQWREGLP